MIWCGDRQRIMGRTMAWGSMARRFGDWSAVGWGSKRIICTIAASATAAMLLLAAFLIHAGYRDAIARAEAATRSITAVAEENILRTLDMSEVVAKVTLDDLARRGGTADLSGDANFTARLRKHAEHLPAQGVIWIVDASGRLLLQSERDRPDRSVSFADREWFKAHAEDGAERHVGEAVLGRVHRELFFTYGRRIDGADGSFQGVVLISLRPVFFHASLFQPEFQDGGAVTLLRLDGATVARVPFKPEMLARRTRHARVFNDLEGQPFGTYWSPSLYENTTRLISFRRLDAQPLIVLASIRSDVVFERWRETAILTAALLVLTLGVIVALTWLGLKASAREDEARRTLTAFAADRQMLFAEAHHRIKNNLAMITSFLRLHAGRQSDTKAREVLRAAESRVASIGLVHDMLHTMEPGSHIALDHYLTKVIDEVTTSHGAQDKRVRVTSIIAPVALDSARAIPLATVLAELISNAFKHAFTDGAGGDLRVTLVSDGETLELEIRDSGPGLPATMRGDSLGTKLIASLAAQIGATQQVYNDDGAVVRLTLPMAAAA